MTLALASRKKEFRGNRKRKKKRRKGIGGMLIKITTGKAE